MGIQHFLSLTVLLSVLPASTDGKFIPSTNSHETLPASTDGFDGINIDCGLSVENPYTDENSLIWAPDSKYLANGVELLSKVANISELASNDAMNTLRYFTGEMNKKYCYQVKMEAQKNAKVLVRVSFKYGNYDNKLDPPKFNLSFDGFDWDTVQTSLTEVETYEVIYKVKADIMSVCVSQTEVNQFPFMSLLQVSHLDPTAYANIGDDYALYRKRTHAFGAMKPVRHPMDKYDRIWYPALTTRLVRVANNSSINTEHTDNKPPQEVMRSARTSLNISYNITISTAEYPFYMTMYFSELSQLNSTQKRSFRVYQNDNTSSETIIPPYGSVLERNVYNLADSPDITIYLRPNNDSTLPPLINALELFYVSKLPVVGTSTSTAMLPVGAKSISEQDKGQFKDGLITDPLRKSTTAKSTTAEINIQSSLLIIIWATVVGAFPFPM